MFHRMVYTVLVVTIYDFLLICFYVEEVGLIHYVVFTYLWFVEFFVFLFQNIHFMVVVSMVDACNNLCVLMVLT